MRCRNFGVAAGVILAVGACERSLEDAPCPCTGTDECCFADDRCHPKGKCPQPTWLGPWSTASTNHPLIDDFEHGNGVIYLDEGRVGRWYSYSDSQGVLFPQSSVEPIKPELEPGSGNHAMHADFSHKASAEASPPDELFAFVGVDLQHNGQKYGHYDASRYDGISFRARGSSKLVKVRVNPVESAYVAYGGTCNDPCTPWSASIEITDSWQRFDIPFAMLTRADDPAPHPIDTTTLTNIQFQFVNGFTKELVDLWLDDVAFLPRE